MGLPDWNPDLHPRDKRGEWAHVASGDHAAKKLALAKARGNSPKPKQPVAPATSAPLNVTSSAPAKGKPVVLMYGGAFNPVHTGHVGALHDAHQTLTAAGYKVDHVVVAPTADKLLAKKTAPEKRLSLDARARVARAAFPKEINGSTVTVATGPSEAVEKGTEKPRRTDLAKWAQERYPNHTIVNVTGEDATVPGAPEQHPSLYSGEIGSNHHGFNYLTLPRDEKTSMSSSKIRAAEEAGQSIPGMTPESERAYRNELARHRLAFRPAPAHR